MPITQYILNIKQQLLGAGILILWQSCRLLQRAEGSGCQAGGRGPALLPKEPHARRAEPAASPQQPRTPGTASSRRAGERAAPCRAGKEHGGQGGNATHHPRR